MGRKRQKIASESMAGRDRIEELPDGIHEKIISLLPLREAVRTSAVSKRWRFIWRIHSDLKLDFVNVLGRRSHVLRNTWEIETMEQRRRFVNRVNHIMNQLSMGGEIKSLAVYFHLGKFFSSCIDHWINVAVLKGVQSIDFDFSESTSFRIHGVRTYSFELYEFRSSLLGERCKLKQLRLDSCILSAPLSYSSLRSLISVELRRLSITDELLNDFLSNCLLVKKLSLHLCKDLINLKFTNPNHQLKFLDIKDCFRLNGIVISSENLTRLEYTGHLINFYFKQVHRLSEVFLRFTNHKRVDAVTYALTKLASKLPNLEKLNLFSILSIKAVELPDNVSVFRNLKQLVLTIYPFDDEDKLNWIVYILSAFPLLQKLELNLFSPNFISQPNAIKRILPKCHREHLTELAINGFNGHQHEVELLMYLLENITSLRRLVVRINQKIFNGFDRWVYEEANSPYKSRMKATISSWLRGIVPKTIHLQVH